MADVARRPTMEQRANDLGRVVSAVVIVARVALFVSEAVQDSEDEAETGRIRFERVFSRPAGCSPAR